MRTVAALQTVAILASGTGLPMCVSGVAQAATPCDMHAGHHSSTARGHGFGIVALTAPSAAAACHQQTAGLGCPAGGGCAPSGPTAPEGLAYRSACTAKSAPPTGRGAMLVSYLTPPPSPPPQA